MTRTMTLAAAFALFALVAVSAQQPAPPAQQPGSPAKPTGDTYPTPAPVANPPANPPAPQYGVIGPAPNFTGNTGTLDPAGYTVGGVCSKRARGTRPGTCIPPDSLYLVKRGVAGFRSRGSRSRSWLSATARSFPAAHTIGTAPHRTRTSR